MILGPMFAGKTTQLLERYEKNTETKQPSVLVHYAGDTRYFVASTDKQQQQQQVTTHQTRHTAGGAQNNKEDNAPAVITHDGKACFATLSTFHLVDVFRLLVDNSNNNESTKMLKYTTVFIDETHLFADADIVVPKLLSMGITVHLTAIKGDFQNLPFPVISKLLPYAFDVLVLKAVCTNCPFGTSVPAEFTIKKTSTTAVAGGDSGTATVDIGGAEKYQPACGSCHALSATKASGHALSATPTTTKQKV